MPARDPAPSAPTVARSIFLVVTAVALLGLPSSGAEPSLEPTLEQLVFDGAGLRQTYDVAISPDGAHVYTHGGQDCLAVFARDDTTGDLMFRQVRCNSEVPIDGLENDTTNAGGLTVSPDGGHLYVASGDGLVTFARDAATGEIAFVDLLRDGVGGVVGIAEPFDVIVSPDGSFAYAADRTGAVAVFTRDNMTGTLSFVEALFDNAAGVDGIGDARGLAMSPGAEHLYVVSGFSAASDQSLAVFSRDSGTGELSFVQALFDDIDGIDGLGGASDVVVSPDGKHVYVTADRDNALAIFSRDVASGMLTFVQALFNNAGGITRLNDPRGLAIRPDGCILAVTGQFGDAVSVFARDSMTGLLTLVEEGTNGSLGATGIRDPVAVIFDGDGDHAYVAARDRSGPGGVVALASAPATGAQTFVEYVNDDSTGVFSLGSPDDAVVSADGRFLYAFGGGDVTVFARDASTGHLSLIEIINDGSPGVSSLSGPRALSLSPNESHLYASSEDDPFVVIFDRDASTGQLTFADEITPEDDNPLNDLVISADGLFLYASADSPSAVHVYGRDPVSGSLAFLQSLEDDVGAQGIGGPRTVVLSPGDGQLYVAGDDDDAIARFDRNASTGLLTFVDAVMDGVGGVSGLDRVEDIAMSADGAHLYATSEADDAVTVFARDAGTGALTFIESLVDGTGGITGLDGVFRVQVAADGTFVLVGSAGNDSTLALFLRDTISGRLRFAARAQALDPGDNDVLAIRLSPDGMHAYILLDSRTPDAVSVFSLPSIVFADGFESGGLTRWSATVP